MAGTRQRVDYSRMNEYRFELVHKDTGKHSHSTQFCCGNIFKRIQECNSNMKAMCLIGVDNTCQIEAVISLATGETIYRNPYYGKKEEEIHEKNQNDDHDQR